MVRNSADKDASINNLDSLNLSSKALGELVKAFVEKGTSIQFRARGNSMFPIIKDGDTITVSPYFGSLPEPGDIVAFMDSKTEKMIVHRIMGLSSNGFITKGDNCFRKDTNLSRKNILGYISKINNRKHILCGVNYIKFKHFITFCSRLRLTSAVGRILIRADKPISNC